jgi:hypothetical protein
LADDGDVPLALQAHRRHLPGAKPLTALVLLDPHHLVAVEDDGAPLALHPVVLVVPGVLPAGGEPAALVLGVGPAGELQGVEGQALPLEAGGAGVPLPPGDRPAVLAGEVPDLVEVVDAALDQDGVGHLVAEGGPPGQGLAVVGPKAGDDVADLAQAAGIEHPLEGLDAGGEAVVLDHLHLDPRLAGGPVGRPHILPAVRDGLLAQDVEAPGRRQLHRRAVEPGRDGDAAAVGLDGVEGVLHPGEATPGR